MESLSICTPFFVESPLHFFQQEIQKPPGPRCRGLLKHFDQMTGRGLITSPEIEVTSSRKFATLKRSLRKKTHLKMDGLEYDFVSFLGASQMPIFQVRTCC